MNVSPHNSNSGRRLSLRFVVGVVVLSLFAAACGSSDDQLDTIGAAAAAVDPIETNDGGVLVKPPDVLDGDVEPTPDVPPLVDGLEPTPIVPFTYFDGTESSTSEFAGRPTVLNFWASNCAPCVAEMPEFEAVHVAWADQVDFVGLNVNDTSRQAAETLAQRTGVTYPLADDSRSLVFREFGGFVMPMTVFLNAQGQVAFTWRGVLTAQDLENLIVEHILPESESDV